ncbi:MAG TPA: hypothetical protein VFJ97_08760 [Dermatophilaceae bacterium]|nr:hypothetical protein [Dermatophilaceae bacterium]
MKDQDEPEQGDLEYDLAHEATLAARAKAGKQPLTYVATQTDQEGKDDGGDYGYDMSHDVPKQ